MTTTDLHSGSATIRADAGRRSSGAAEDVAAVPHPAPLHVGPSSQRRSAADRARRFSVAPMMDWTDSICRRFHRLLTREALLYTEMLHANAVLYGDRARLLRFDADEQPLAVQLGGSEPRVLAAAARICEDAGFVEINLNVGCPSERVQSGAFGACLMAEPERVADCVAAMRAAVALPVTVKHRIGIDNQDAEADLERFASTVAAAGCDAFIVHARKAWLQGLDPKANREVPPLDHARVRRLKARHPDWNVVINGGLRDPHTARVWLDPGPASGGAAGAGSARGEADECLPALDGVMLGRAAYHEPALLLDVDSRYFDRPSPLADDAEVVEALVELAARLQWEGGQLPHLTRHVTGLFHGQPGGRRWRRRLSEDARRATNYGACIRAAADEVLSLRGETSNVGQADVGPATAETETRNGR